MSMEKYVHSERTCIPYLFEETKLLMKERDALKSEATANNDKTLLEEYTQKRN